MLEGAKVLVMHSHMEVWVADVASRGCKYKTAYNIRTICDKMVSYQTGNR